LIEANWDQVLVLELDMKLRGYCAWIVVPRTDGYTVGAGTYVEEGYSNNGWGTLLQRDAAKAAKGRGGKLVIGVVGLENKAARKMVQKTGWEETGVEILLDLTEVR